MIFVFRQFTSYIFIVLLALSLISCKGKPIKQPELQDPIYNSLLKKISRAKEVESMALNEAKSALKKLKEAVPQSGQSQVHRNEYFKKISSSKREKQKIKYYELRAETRKLHVRKVYLEAFKNDKPWKNEREVASYETIDRLQTERRKKGNSKVPKF